MKARPTLRRLLSATDQRISRWHHALAETFPELIRPRPRQLTVAVTAACNLRCLGCRLH